MKDLCKYNITPFESVSAVIVFLKRKKIAKIGFHIITANPEIVYEAVFNEDYTDTFHSADLVVADGIGVSQPMKWKGYTSNRVPGIEIFESIINDEILSKNGVYLLGAKPEVIKLAADNLMGKDIDICGYQDGYFSLDDVTIEALAKSIKQHNPSVVAVAMGAPIQDYVISKLISEGIDAIFIGVGGAFDVLSGEVKRAPVIAQKTKLEWLYRLFCDLSRLPRYKKILQYLIWLFKG